VRCAPGHDHGTADEQQADDDVRRHGDEEQRHDHGSPPSSKTEVADPAGHKIGRLTRNMLSSGHVQTPV
jgi:hypothetical protein